MSLLKILSWFYVSNFQNARDTPRNYVLLQKHWKHAVVAKLNKYTLYSELLPRSNGNQGMKMGTLGIDMKTFQLTFSTKSVQIFFTLFVSCVSLTLKTEGRLLEIYIFHSFKYFKHRFASEIFTCRKHLFIDNKCLSSLEIQKQLNLAFCVLYEWISAVVLTILL